MNTILVIRDIIRALVYVVTLMARGLGGGWRWLYARLRVAPASGSRVTIRVGRAREQTPRGITGMRPRLRLRARV